MKGGRKNLKRAAESESFTLQKGQSVMQVVSLRGSNLIEVMDTKGETSLALFPAKFKKSMWMKQGSFVVVDESGREEAVEAGRKVGCIVSQVLFHEQLRLLQKSSDCLMEIMLDLALIIGVGRAVGSVSFYQAIPENGSSVGRLVASRKQSAPLRPEIFNSKSLNSSKEDLQREGSLQAENELNSSDDDGLPPLEANTNRLRPAAFQSDRDSDSDSDS
ncbi:hypothetical protein LguiA_034741 [Lonicera macranthoides]